MIVWLNMKQVLEKLEEQMYYPVTRGFSEDDAMNLVVNGFVKMYSKRR